MLDGDGDSDIDFDDVEAMVASVVDDGADVIVNFTTGAGITFEGLGTGSITQLSQLVGDVNTQVLIA